MRKPRTYRQLIDLQNLLVEVAKRTETRPSAICQCASAFAGLEYLRRVMLMRANPKPIEVAPSGAARPMIDYRRLVRRPGQKAIIDVAEPKPPGPKTQITSSDYYAPKVTPEVPIVAKAEEAPSSQAPITPEKPPVA